jgi:hypothetical protein
MELKKAVADAAEIFKLATATETEAQRAATAVQLAATAEQQAKAETQRAAAEALHIQRLQLEAGSGVEPFPQALHYLFKLFFFLFFPSANDVQPQKPRRVRLGQGSVPSA